MLSTNVELIQNCPADSETVAALWFTIRRHLEAQKAEIYAEINSYPLPITACDDQFKHLLEKRSRICQELGQLDAASQATLPYDAAIQQIQEFVESATFIRDKQKFAP